MSNQVDYKSVKSEPLVESSGLQSRKQPKTDGADWTKMFDGLKSSINKTACISQLIDGVSFDRIKNISEWMMIEEAE